MTELAAHHREALHASGITDEVFAERGYFASSKPVELRSPLG